MELALYYFPSCPYCRKVTGFLEAAGKRDAVQWKDIRADPSHREELARINDGRTQVPCLVIDGEPMLESDDIVEWLRRNLPQ